MQVLELMNNSHAQEIKRQEICIVIPLQWSALEVRLVKLKISLSL